MTRTSHLEFPHSITTPRLTLVAATAGLVQAEMEELPHFFRLLDVRPRRDWPPEDLADALPFFREELESRPDLAGWLSWYWILRPESPARPPDEGPKTNLTDRALALLIGAGGFKGPPVNGTGEIGYHVLAPYRRRGYATEAVRALLGWAFDHAGVHAVAAHTAVDNAPSLALLARLGFKRVSGPDSDGLIRLILRHGSPGRTGRVTRSSG
jgi:RimJ/RimL family protein N-acetyltransferase